MTGRDPLRHIVVDDTHDWRASWPLPHESVDVLGAHFTVLEDHAERTVGAVRAWIDALDPSIGKRSI